MSKNADLKKLNAFLRKNQSVDFRLAGLHGKSTLNSLKWDVSEPAQKSFHKQPAPINRIDALKVFSAEKTQKMACQALTAYQCLLPDDIEESTMDNTAGALLEIGFTSALQVADMPKTTFMKETLKVFSDDAALVERVYQRAVSCRKDATLNDMNRIQGLELHARAAGLNR